MHTTIVGNITDDPELRFTPSGAAVANFTVAENRRKLDRNTNEWEDVGTTFVRCSVWRQAAENVAETLQRGMRVIVHGELFTETYEKRDGGGTGLSVIMNVTDVGPSVKYATAKVAKTERQNAGNGGGGQQRQQAARDPWAAPQGGGQAAPADPWASPGGNAPPAEPPF